MASCWFLLLMLYLRLLDICGWYTMQVYMDSEVLSPKMISIKATFGLQTEPGRYKWVRKFVRLQNCSSFFRRFGQKNWVECSVTRWAMFVNNFFIFLIIQFTGKVWCDYILSFLDWGEQSFQRYFSYNHQPFFSLVSLLQTFFLTTINGLYFITHLYTVTQKTKGLFQNSESCIMWSLF